MPHPVQGSAPWDEIEEANEAALFAAQQAEIDGIVGAGGDMLKSDNLAGLTSLPDAQANLGLKGAATLDVGQDTGTVAAGDDPRIVGALQASNDLLGVNPTNARVNLDVYSTEEVDTAIIEAFPIIGDPVDIIHGGTGGNTAATARTNLDVYSKAESDAIGGGGGGSVDTVNGQSGPDITLTASDVGADASGVAAGLVSTEASTRAAADSTNAAAITAEATTRGTADTTNATAISTETTRATAAEGTNATAITTEATARAGADTTLQTNITSEASTRATADTTLQTNITSEASTRATADSTLQTNITAEASTRATADTTNATAITGETTRATTAEALLAPKASPTFTGTVSGITAGMVGLGNVDNTSDTTKNAAAVTLTNKIISDAANTITMTYPAPFQYGARKLDIKSRNYLAMRNARKALALGSASVLFLGDSITEGSSLTNTYDRWVNRVCDILANTVSAASPGVGYVPMATVNSSGLNASPSTPLSPVSNFWVHTGALGDLSANGLGQRGILTAAGSTSASTATVACTSFDLYYNKKNTFGGITVTVDGGAPITINANGTGTITMAKWNSNTDGGLTLTAGAHLIAIATTNAGVTNATYLNDIAGVFFYLGNETSGVRPFEAGHPTYPSQNTQTRELQQIALIQPDVVFINWGANDSAFSIAPATTASNFAALITSINGVCTVAPTYVFLATWGQGGGVEATWLTYRDAIFQQAITSGAAYVDMYERLGWQSTSTTLQDSNHVHPNVAGSKAYADAVVDALGITGGFSPDGSLHSPALAGGGSYVLGDIGLNSVSLAIQTSLSDPFASAFFGLFGGVPTLGFGPRTTLFDTSMTRGAQGVFTIGNAIKLTGLPGATASSRQIGAVASGVPATGTFSIGDVVIDRTGRLGVCTAAGGSGTWAMSPKPYNTRTQARTAYF